MASLNIDLDPNPSKTPYYRPGSRISGTVHLDTPTSSSIATATIILRGRAKVKIRSSEHYTTRTFRSRALFFPPQTIILFDASKVTGNVPNGDADTSPTIGSHFTHKPGKSSWHFEFHLPEEGDVQSIVLGTHHPASKEAAQYGSAAFSTSKPKRYLDNMGMMQRTSPQVNEADGTVQHENDYFTPRRPWRGSKDPRPHPLPDSFTYISSRWPLDWECRVEYSLHATVSRPGGGSALFRDKDLVNVTEIPVHSVWRSYSLRKQSLDDQLRQQQHKTIEASLLTSLDSSTSTDPAATTPLVRRLSLLDKTKSIILPSSTLPKHTIPFRITISRNLQSSSLINLGIQQDSTTSRPTKSLDGASPPSNKPVTSPILRMTLTSLSIQLSTTTSIRDNAQTALEQITSRTDNVTLYKNKSLSLLLPITDICGSVSSTTQPSMFTTPTTKARISEIRMPKDLVASFTTYNISRSYKLTVETKLSIAGRETVSLEPAVFEVDVLPDVAARPASAPAPVLPSPSASAPVPGYAATKPAPRHPSAGNAGEAVPAYETVVDVKERVQEILGDDVKSAEGPRARQPPKDEDEDYLPAYEP